MNELQKYFFKAYICAWVLDYSCEVINGIRSTVRGLTLVTRPPEDPTCPRLRCAGFIEI